MNALQLDEKQQQNIFAKMEKAKPTWMEQIEHSFLSKKFKKQYKQIVRERFDSIAI
jgi:serine/threonine-protein kinase HipA